MPQICQNFVLYKCKIKRFNPGFVKFGFISMVLLRIPTAVQPMPGIKGFKYQASDG